MSGKKIAAVATSIIIIAVLAIGVVIVINHSNKKIVTVKTITMSAQGQQQTQTKTSKVTKATNIKSTVAAWKAAGLTVSDDQGVYYQTIGANNGGKYDVDAMNVELYEFSDNTKANDAKTSYFTSDSDTVRITGTLLIDIHSTDSIQFTPIEAVF